MLTSLPTARTDGPDLVADLPSGGGLRHRAELLHRIPARQTAPLPSRGWFPIDTGLLDAV